MVDSRSEIWDAVLTHLMTDETIEIDDLDEFDKEEARSVLSFMEEEDWVVQLNDSEWSVGIMMQRLRTGQ